MRKLIFCNSFKISRFVVEKMFLILHLISLVFRNLSYFFVACILCLSCLIYVICVWLDIMVSNTYCVVFLSCVPNVASFSESSILDCSLTLTFIIPSPTKLRRDIVTLRPSFRNILVNTLESTSLNGF